MSSLCWTPSQQAPPSCLRCLWRLLEFPGFMVSECRKFGSLGLLESFFFYLGVEKFLHVQGSHLDGSPEVSNSYEIEVRVSSNPQLTGL